MLNQLYTTADAVTDTVTEFAPSFISTIGIYARTGALKGVGDLSRSATILGGATVAIVGIGAVTATTYGAVKGTKRLFRWMRDDRPSASEKASWGRFRKTEAAAEPTPAASGPIIDGVAA